MLQKELLDSVKKYLAKFEAQVKISNLNNEYDINIHAENVIIPVLNLIYNCNLKNANAECKNAEAIDLIDEDKRIAFQITSETSIAKVKDTLSKFLHSKFVKKVDDLYIYMLRGKQGAYTQRIIDDIVMDRLEFSAKKNIIDATDIYRRLWACNDLLLIKKIELILREQLSDLHITRSLTMKTYEEFRVSYKQSCISNFSRINFFGLHLHTNKPREIALDSLFVNPLFSFNGTFDKYRLPLEEHNFLQEISFKDYELSMPHISYFYIPDVSEMPGEFDITIKHLETSRDIVSPKEVSKGSDLVIHLKDKYLLRDIFSGPRHIAVVGNPGAGKSLFIKYSICKLLEKDMNAFSNKEIYDYIPFRIELNKYSKFKESKSMGIFDYLATVLQTEYQQTISKDIILSLLQTMPVLFFFDGLDEIFNIQERIAVRNDIEIFTSRFPYIRSVVTSRYESYQEVSMSKSFCKFEILDFDDSQIEEYVRKWYTIEEPDPFLREREVASCLQQLVNIEPELNNNPLLLSLILLLYRNEADMPTSKLSIYESCTNTIAVTRDTKEKKLDLTLRIDNKLSIFASLAYWQFKSESGDKVLPSFEDVRNHIKNYLLSKGELYEEGPALLAAEEFLEFAKLRSIYFENKFTHKTFFEYFTAYYIYSYYYNNWHKASKLSKLLSGYIGMSSWSVVLELLICKIDSSQINYEMIDELISASYLENEIESLLFFLPLLKYLRNVSPRMVKFIIHSAILFCFKEGSITMKPPIRQKEMLFNLLCSIESLERFRRVINDVFRDLAKAKNVNDVWLNAFAYEFSIRTGNDFLVQILKEIDAESADEYIFILRNYHCLAENVNYLELLTVFIKAYSRPRSHVSVTTTYSSPFGQKLFFNSEKFNWAVTYLWKNCSRQKTDFSLEQLMAAGMSIQTLIDSARNNSGIISSNVASEINTTQSSKHLRPVINELHDSFTFRYRYWSIHGYFRGMSKKAIRFFTIKRAEKVPVIRLEIDNKPTTGSPEKPLSQGQVY